MKTLLLFAGLFTFVLFAEEASTGKLGHESEAGIVLVTGNSDTQTYSLKQATGYEWEANKTKLTASYLLGKTSGIETANKWDLGIRYDRVVTGNLSVFLGYQLDSNRFAGTDLRHTVDLGGKYQWVKTDMTELLSELGYRMTAENFTNDSKLTSHMTRLYTEWKQNWNKSVTSKLWAEYLQSYTNTDDYRFNLEPSLSVILTDILSLKLAYLVNYRHVPAVVGAKQTDTIYTTSLVAKF